MFVLRTDTPLVEVVRLMVGTGLGAMPTRSENGVGGVWTESELLKVVRHGGGDALIDGPQHPPVTVHEGVRFRQALKVFAQTNARVLLKVDDVGMVVDAIDQPTLAQRLVDWINERQEPVDFLMRVPVTLTEDYGNLGEVVDAMLDGRVLAIPFVDSKGRLLYWLTASDLLQAWLEWGELIWDQPPVAAARTTESLMTVPEGMALNTVLKKMMAGRVRRMPVLGGQERSCGVISMIDILAFANEHLPQEAQLERPGDWRPSRLAAVTTT